MPLFSGSEKLAVNVLHLAGTGVAFVVEDDVVGALHDFFGRELAADAGMYLLRGCMVAVYKTCNAFIKAEVDTDHLVDKVVQVGLIDDGTFKNDIRGSGMGVGKVLEVVPHAGMDEAVELGEFVGVGKDDAGNGGFVGYAVRGEDAVAEEVANAGKESGVLIVGSCNLVGNETGNTQGAESVQNGGFAATDAPGEGNKEGKRVVRHEGSVFLDDDVLHL